MHLPANTFSARHESCGEVTAGDTGGTTLTAPVAPDTKPATYTTIKTATSFAYEGIHVHLGSPSAVGSWIVDIGIDDGAANVFILVPDLFFPGAKHAEGTAHYFIPVHIPSGAKIVARAQSTVVSGTIELCLTGGSANVGGFPGFSRVIGLNAFSTSRGPAVDAGGTADDKGAWTELVASSSQTVGGLFYAVGHNGDTARAAGLGLLDIGLGAAGVEQIVAKDMFFAFNTSFDGPTMLVGPPFPALIPAGSRLAARISCSNATAGDRTIDLALYGLVP